MCVCSVMFDFLRPHRLQPTRLPCPWNFPGKNTGVGYHFLLLGIFLTQGSNSHLLHWQVDFFFLPLSHLENPWIFIVVSKIHKTLSATVASTIITLTMPSQSANWALIPVTRTVLSIMSSLPVTIVFIFQISSECTQVVKPNLHLEFKLQESLGIVVYRSLSFS